MQFKVPQNVQREDTIMGPLTMKQLIIAILGGGIAWLFWTAIKPPLSYPFVLLTLIITTAFVLVKINGMTFVQFLEAVILLLLRPRSRSWDKGSGEVWFTGKDISDLAKIRAERAKKKKHEIKKNLSKLNEVEQLAQLLDTRGRMKKELKK